MGKLHLFDLWQARRQLAAWVVLGATSAMVFGLVHSGGHEVAMRLLVEPGLGPLDNGKLMRDRNFMPTQAEIVSSPAVLESALAEMARDPTLPAPPLPEVLASLRVDPLIGSNVLSIRYSHEDSEIACRLSAHIVSAYERFLVDDERHRMKNSLASLAAHQRHLEEREGALRERRRQLRHETELVGIGREQDDLQRDLLNELFQRISVTRGRRLHLEQQLKTLEQFVDTDRQNVATSGGSNDLHFVALQVLQRAVGEGWAHLEDPAPLKQALLSAELRLAELSESAGAKHANVISLQAQIRLLKEKIEVLTGQVPEMFRRELFSTKVEEDQLQQLYDEELARLKALDDHRIEEQRLVGQLEQVRQEQSQVAAEIVQRRLIIDSQSPHPHTVVVRRLEGPSITARPLIANRKIMVALGAGFGLLGGVLALAYTANRRVS